MGLDKSPAHFSTLAVSIVLHIDCYVSDDIVVFQL